MWKEFKEFAFKGNVVDMAVGVIIGGAFGKIVSSIVNDIVMPVIGYALAGINFADLKIVLQQAVYDAEGAIVTPENAIRYGAFIQEVVDFFIVALSIFIVVKLINNGKKRQDEMHKKLMAKIKKGELPPEEEEAAADPTELDILTEIRDLLLKDAKPEEAGDAEAADAAENGEDASEAEA